MLQDPYAVLRALLRAEAVRSAPKPSTPPAERKPQLPKPEERGRR